MAQEKKAYPVSLLCRVMGVSRSGFYDYERRIKQPPDPHHEELLDRVRRLSQAADHTYGSRRMSRALRALGYAVGRRRATTLMREAGIWVRYRKRYRLTTQSRHRHPVCPNRLQRQFRVEKPNQAWVGDISYIWTHEGWLYVAVVIDLYSRKIVGWSMRPTLSSRLVGDALRMALWERRPAPGLMFHSDRGVQYASHEFQRLLKAHGIIGSMSRKGDCWDNSVAESFFGRLKSERVHWRNYQTRNEARADIVDYITMHYNSHRLHSYLGYMSPDTFEKTGHMATAS